MGFPEALAQAQRSSLLADIIETLDRVEELHRQIQLIDSAHLVGLDAASFGTATKNVKAAYNSLAQARHAVETGS